MKRIVLYLVLAFLGPALFGQDFFTSVKKYHFDVAMENGYMEFELAEEWIPVWEKSTECREYFTETPVQFQFGTYESGELNNFWSLWHLEDFDYLKKSWAALQEEGKVPDVGPNPHPSYSKDIFYEYYKYMKGLEADLGDVHDDPSSVFDFKIESSRTIGLSYKTFFEKYQFSPYSPETKTYRFTIYQLQKTYKITFHPAKRNEFTFQSKTDLEAYKRFVFANQEGISQLPLEDNKLFQKCFPLINFWGYSRTEKKWIPEHDLLPLLESADGLTIDWEDWNFEDEEKVFSLRVYGPLDYHYIITGYCCPENKEDLGIPKLILEDEHGSGEHCDDEDQSADHPKVRRESKSGFRLGGADPLERPQEEAEEGDQGLLPIPTEAFPIPGYSSNQYFDPDNVRLVSFTATSSGIAPSTEIGNYNIVLCVEDIGELPDVITLHIDPAYFPEQQFTTITADGISTLVTAQPYGTKPTCVDIPIQTDAPEKPSGPAIIHVNVPIPGICAGSIGQPPLPVGTQWEEVVFVPLDTTVTPSMFDFREDELTQEQQYQITAFEVFQFGQMVQESMYELKEQGVLTDQLQGYKTPEDLLAWQWISWNYQEEMLNPNEPFSETILITQQFDSTYWADVETASGVPRDQLPEEYQEAFTTASGNMLGSIEDIMANMGLEKGEGITIESEDDPVPNAPDCCDEEPEVTCYRTKLTEGEMKRLGEKFNDLSIWGSRIKGVEIGRLNSPLGERGLDFLKDGVAFVHKGNDWYAADPDFLRAFQEWEINGGDQFEYEWKEGDQRYKICIDVVEQLQPQIEGEKDD